MWDGMSSYWMKELFSIPKKHTQKKRGIGQIVVKNQPCRYYVYSNSKSVTG